MAQKILVSKPTKNVLDGSLSLNDFYFHSDYPHLKVHASGTFSINSPAGSVGTTITHDLGYYAFAIVFSEFVADDGTVTTNKFYQHSWDILLGGEIFGFTTLHTDRIEIRVGAPTNGSETVEGFYFIFKEDVG
jgi:hypothetical protein